MQKRTFATYTLQCGTGGYKLRPVYDGTGSWIDSATFNMVLHDLEKAEARIKTLETMLDEFEKHHKEEIAWIMDKYLARDKHE